MRRWHISAWSVVSLVPGQTHDQDHKSIAQWLQQGADVCQGDIRYHIFQMAVCKTGHKALFSSPINNKDIHVYLMEQTNCNTLFSGEGVHVGDILADRPMKHVVIPSLEELLNMDEVPHYPYDKTFDEAKNDPFVVLHTSGTTGMPVGAFFVLRIAGPRKLLHFKTCPSTNRVSPETYCLESCYHGHPRSTTAFRRSSWQEPFTGANHSW